MAKELKLELLENAFDYVLQAASHAKQDDPRAWKYAVLDLFAGIELILKEALRQEHWSLLFADVNKASASSLSTGDFKSVDFDTCCIRLGNIVGAPLTKAEVGHLEALRKLRNRVQHFDAHLEEVAAKSSLAIGLSFFVDFYKNHVKEGVDDTAFDTEEMLGEIYEHLAEFKEFVAHRKGAIKPKLKSSVRYFECPRCLQDTVDLRDGEPKCLLCEFELEPDALADFISMRSGAGSITECPSCDAETLVEEERGHWVCTTCGEGGDYDRCLKCDRLFEPTDEESVCDDCFRAAVNSD